MKRSSDKNILLIGYDEHILLSVAYTLKNGDYNLIVLTNKRYSACNFSRYIDHVIFYEESDEILSKVKMLADRMSVELIVPVGENESLEILKILEKINKLAKVVPLTDLRMYEKAIDKALLRKHLIAQGIHLMPESVGLESRDNYKQALKLRFPVLLKPSRGSFGRGIETKISKNDLEKYLASCHISLAGFEAQEYIEGSLVTCNIYARKGKVKVYTIQESPVKEILNYSTNDDLIFKEDKQVFQIVSTVAKSLNWEGIACFDLIREKKSGRIFLLEINGRFWGSVASSLIKAKVNFAEYMINDALSMPQKEIIKKESVQISLDTFFSYLKRARLFSIRDTKYSYYFSDPVARLYKIYKSFFSQFLGMMQ